MIDRDPNKKVEKLERIDAYWVKSTIEITVIFLSKLLMPITKKKLIERNGTLAKIIKEI